MHWLPVHSNCSCLLAAICEAVHLVTCSFSTLYPATAIARSWVRIPPTSAVYQRQLSVPSLRGRLMITSESWGVNGHTTRCIGPVSVVLRLRLVSGWGLWNVYQRRPMGLKARERTLLSILQPWSCLHHVVPSPHDYSLLTHLRNPFNVPSNFPQNWGVSIYPRTCPQQLSTSQYFVYVFLSCSLFYCVCVFILCCCLAFWPPYMHITL